MSARPAAAVCLVAVLLVLTLPAVSWSQETPKGVAQFPDMANGSDLQSQWDAIDGDPNVVRADNWRCPNGLPVAGIHWWGSYESNITTEPVGAFEISVYADSAGLPYALLYRETFDLSTVNETSIGFDAQGEEVFEYTAYLIDPFEQTQGEIYWLCVVAITEGQTTLPEWGWHTAVSDGIESLLLGSAQTTKDPSSVDPAFGGNTVDLWQDETYDMAFDLYTIPEPAALSLIGLGLLGLLSARRRR